MEATEVLSTVKSNVDAMCKGFEEFKTAHAQSTKERDALTEAKIQKIIDDITQKHEATDKLIKALQAQPSRPALIDSKSEENKAKDLELFIKAQHDFQDGKGQPVAAVTAEQLDLYRKAWNRYARVRHHDLLEPDERKALSIGSDPDGGYWILPPTVSQRVVTRIFETSPMREVAAQETIGTHAYRIPEDPNEVDAGWVSEQGTRPETATAQIALKEITPQEIYAMPKASQQLLEDGAIDFETWISNKVADKISRVENLAFISGNGVGKARGILTYPSGTAWNQLERVGSGSSGAFTYSGLINIITSIKDAYQANASFFIRRQSIAQIMLLTDGSGRYIFQPVLNGSFNNTPLLGYPVKYATDMPAPSAGSLSLAFGDFRRGYQIVDRIGISMIRDNLTAKPYILFYTRKRTGGDVVDFDAIKLQVLT